MKNTFTNIERLKQKKHLDVLFEKGEAISDYPLRIVYCPMVFDDDVPYKVGVSVSKRIFKKAVDRNRIKRLLREAFRLNKRAYFNNITTQYAFMILYIGKKKPTFDEVEAHLKSLLEKLDNRISPK